MVAQPRRFIVDKLQQLIEERRLFIADEQRWLGDERLGVVYDNTSLTLSPDSVAAEERSERSHPLSSSADAEADGGAEPDGAACPAVTPPAQPQVLSGEVAQVTSQCGADGELYS